MNKKWVLALTLLFPTLGSCSALDFTTHEISTAEDFFAMKDGRNYQLVADIDLQGQAFTPVKVKSFDGGGFVIHNFTIRESPKDEYYGLFKEAKTVSNLEIYDFQLSISANESYITVGGICGTVHDKAENLFVHDGTINVNSTYRSNLASHAYCGGVIGDLRGPGNHLRAENLRITMNSVTGGFVGGILGTGNNVELDDSSSSRNSLVCNASGASVAGVSGFGPGVSLYRVTSQDNTLVATDKGKNGSYAYGVSSSLSKSKIVASRGNSMKAMNCYGIAGSAIDSNEILSAENIFQGSKENSGLAGTMGEIQNAMSLSHSFSGAESEYGMCESVQSYVQKLAVDDVDARTDVFSAEANDLYLDRCVCGSNVEGPNCNRLEILSYVDFLSLIDSFELDPEVWEKDENTGSYRLAIEMEENK